MLDALANQELRVKVELIDEGAVLEGLQKVANRITLGLALTIARHDRGRRVVK